MDSSPHVPPQEFAVSMRAEFDQLAEEVMEVVNEAPDGQWIAASEEKVRDLCAEMRRRVFERAVQNRVQAAEAAFPLSAPCDDKKAIHEYKKCKPLPSRNRGAGRPWKEFKVAFFYSEDAQRQHVAFTHGNHETAGKLLRRETDRLRFREADERIAIADGAVWIREQFALHFAGQDAIGLDFYHLRENVHRARSSEKSRRKARHGPTS